jgi:hypothetical protein
LEIPLRGWLKVNAFEVSPLEISSWIGRFMERLKAPDSYRVNEQKKIPQPAPNESGGQV